MKFDIRTLVLPDSSGKVIFNINDIDKYKEYFLRAVRGSDEITLTGAGPAWLHLVLWHEAHGTVPDGALAYEAPGVGRLIPTAAGVTTGDGSAVKDRRVVIDVTTLETAKDESGRLTFSLDRVSDYQRMALAMLPAFTPGVALPEFEVILTGPGTVWLFLALAAALHSRGGAVIYSAPNAPRVVVIDHK